MPSLTALTSFILTCSTHKKLGCPIVGPLHTDEDELTNGDKLKTELFLDAFTYAYFNQRLSNSANHQLY